MIDVNALMINPFEEMEIGRKRAYAGYEAGQAAAQREVLNELYAQALDPRTGQVNVNALYGGLAQRRMGAMIPGMQQQAADVAFKEAQASKQRQDAEIAFLKQSRDDLATISEGDQAAYQAWANRMIERAPWTAKYIAPVLNAQTKKQMLMTADAAMPKGVETDLGGGSILRNPYTGEQIGPTVYNIPEPEPVYRQKEGIARASAPSPAATKFSQAFGDKAATQFDTLYTQAQSAQTSLNLSRRLAPLLNDPKFISGTLGNVRLSIAKALDLPGAEETQTYFSGVGNQVAQIIKAFGAGTGLSDKDREFAEKIAGGSIELTPAAIKRIAKLNDEASKYVIDRYNKRRQQLSAKDPEVGDFYEEIAPPTSSAGPRKTSAGTSYSVVED